MFLILFVLPAVIGNIHSVDWSALNSHREPVRCAKIPFNFTLCHGIQYDTMRLPTLLEHDTVSEAIQQSDAWNSLIRLHCDPEAKIFLCSLFAPVCLPEMDKIIYPCKSLCEKVKQGCLPRMKQYGFDWPDMMSCDKFPADNDMCIKSTYNEESLKHSRMFNTVLPSVRPSTTNMSPPSSTNMPQNNHQDSKRREHKKNNHKTTTSTIIFTTVVTPKGDHSNLDAKRNCQSCVQVPTFENLLDNFCQSTVVAKTKLQPLNATHFKVQKIQRIFKPKVPKSEAKHKDNKTLSVGNLVRIADLTERSDCNCPQKQTNKAYLIMTDGKGGSELKARLILPWQQDKVFKNAVRKFGKVDCNSLGREIRESAMKRGQNGY